MDLVDSNVIRDGPFLTVINAKLVRSMFSDHDGRS